MTKDPYWSAIVLAAGQSNRFGGGKLRAVYRQRPVIEWVMHGILSCPVQEVLVVWGADQQLVQDLPKDERIRAIWAKDHADGIGASLAEGIGAISSQTTGAFVFLGDMPRAPFGLANDMIAAIGQGALAAAPVFDGRRGHPVLICPAVFKQIGQLIGDRGAGAILDKLGAKLTLVDAPDDGCLFDIDHPGDLLA